MSIYVYTSLPFSAITVAYDGSCCLGCVPNVNEQERAITVTFLHPSIPSASFFYPKRKNVLDIDPSDILTRVQPSIATATGRAYTLSKKMPYVCNFAFLMVMCLHVDVVSLL